MTVVTAMMMTTIGTLIDTPTASELYTVQQAYSEYIFLLLACVVHFGLYLVNRSSQEDGETILLPIYIPE